VERVDGHQALVRRRRHPQVRHVPPIDQSIHSGDVGFNSRGDVDTRRELNRAAPGLLSRPAEASGAALVLAEEKAVGAEEQVGGQGLA
jgi:hypothetical protein